MRFEDSNENGEGDEENGQEIRHSICKAGIVRKTSDEACDGTEDRMQ